MTASRSLAIDDLEKVGIKKGAEKVRVPTCLMHDNHNWCRHGEGSPVPVSQPNVDGTGGGARFRSDDLDLDQPGQLVPEMTPDISVARGTWKQRDVRLDADPQPPRHRPGISPWRSDMNATNRVSIARLQPFSSPDFVHRIHFGIQRRSDTS